MALATANHVLISRTRRSPGKTAKHPPGNSDDDGSDDPTVVYLDLAHHLRGFVPANAARGDDGSDRSGVRTGARIGHGAIAGSGANWRQCWGGKFVYLDSAGDELRYGSESGDMAGHERPRKSPRIICPSRSAPPRPSPAGRVRDEGRSRRIGGGTGGVGRGTPCGNGWTANSGPPTRWACTTACSRDGTRPDHSGSLDPGPDGGRSCARRAEGDQGRVDRPQNLYGGQAKAQSAPQPPRSARNGMPPLVPSPDHPSEVPAEPTPSRMEGMPLPPPRERKQTLTSRTSEVTGRARYRSIACSLAWSVAGINIGGGGGGIKPSPLLAEPSGRNPVQWEGAVEALAARIRAEPRWRTPPARDATADGLAAWCKFFAYLVLCTSVPVGSIDMEMGIVGDAPAIARPGSSDPRMLSVKVLGEIEELMGDPREVARRMAGGGRSRSGSLPSASVPAGKGTPEEAGGGAAVDEPGGFEDADKDGRRSG